MANNLVTTWAYALHQDNLVEYLTEFQLDTSGFVEDLRKRWGRFGRNYSLCKKNTKLLNAYAPRKDDLVEYLTEFQLDTSGLVEDLRKRWGRFGRNHSVIMLTRLLALQEKHEVVQSTRGVPNPTSPAAADNETKITEVLTN
uniref:Uncharacterized protein n=1 Tax=Glossina austeni TaxID=7395 RepID=A0A1A9VSJ9_GLOAU